MGHVKGVSRMMVVLAVALTAFTIPVGARLVAHSRAQDRDVSGDPVWLKQQLSQRNLALAGGRPAVREKNQERVLGWLRDDPAYRALANLCLKALGTQRLRRELHLDAVNGKYVQQVDPTAKQLEAEAYNDIPRLQRAMVVHWNEQYPDETIAEFRQMLEEFKGIPEQDSQQEQQWPGNYDKNRKFIVLPVTGSTSGF